MGSWLGKGNYRCKTAFNGVILFVMIVTRCGRGQRGFTLIELLVVMAIIAILAALLLLGLARAKARGQRAACFANLHQIAVAATLYKDDFNGGLFHHHEQWVLDDGSLVDQLPASLSGVTGGGQGNSQAEKPWVIFFQPYLKSRQVAFCPADQTARSALLATDLRHYNGGITSASQSPAPGTEQAIAESQNLAMESYVLDSIFTHKSARYALEGVLSGFATDTVVGHLSNRNIIMFSERNSEGLDAPDNPQYGSITQDDYDTWGGEAQLVQWGTGNYGDQGWIRYHRHERGANYVYNDAHVQWLRWSEARTDQFPDHVVRFPLANPPQ